MNTATAATATATVELHGPFATWKVAKRECAKLARRKNTEAIIVVTGSHHFVRTSTFA